MELGGEGTLNARPMFDPRMLDRLSRFYPSTVDITSTTFDSDEMGSPDSVEEILLEGIPASIAPFNDIVPISGERKLENLLYNTATFRVGMQGYFPEITTKMTVLFNDTGKRYNILGVEWDSHKMTTRLIVNEVTL